MPSPGGRKTKSKPKGPAQTPASSSNSLVVPDAFLGDIDNAEGWSMIVTILCDTLDLPGMFCKKKLYCENELKDCVKTFPLEVVSKKFMPTLIPSTDASTRSIKGMRIMNGSGEASWASTLRCLWTPS